jgi:hypothetical protein
MAAPLISAVLTAYAAKQGEKAARGSKAERDARGTMLKYNLANMPQASEAQGQGLDSLQELLKLYTGLASGSGTEWARYAAPQIEQIGTQNTAALQNMSEFNQRGGGVSSALLNNPMQVATQQSMLANALQENARQQQGALGGSLAQLAQGILSGGTQGGLGVTNQMMSRDQMGYDWGQGLGSGFASMLGSAYGKDGQQGWGDQLGSMWNWLRGLAGGGGGGAGAMGGAGGYNGFFSQPANDTLSVFGNGRLPVNGQTQRPLVGNGIYTSGYQGPGRG